MKKIAFGVTFLRVSCFGLLLYTLKWGDLCNSKMGFKELASKPR